MKTYTLGKTQDEKLFRVIDRKGNWTHYLYQDGPNSDGIYLRSVNAILDAGYAKGPQFYEWLKRSTKEEAEKKLQEAGERGDRVHQFIHMVCDNINKDMATTVEISRTKPVLAEDNETEVFLSDNEWWSILAWQTFWERHAPQVIAYEFPAYNLKFGYAGTGDLLAILTKTCEVKQCPCKDLVGKVGLFDYKTSGAVYDSYGAQVSAYGACGSLKAFLGQKKIDYTAILRLGTEHKHTNGYQFEVYNLPETKKHWEEFLAARVVSEATYRPFDPMKEIYEIQDSIIVKLEFVPKVEKKITNKQKPKNGRTNPRPTKGGGNVEGGGGEAGGIIE